jgi:hypothetical protein
MVRSLISLAFENPSDFLVSHLAIESEPSSALAVAALVVAAVAVSLS